MFILFKIMLSNLLILLIHEWHLYSMFTLIFEN